MTGEDRPRTVRITWTTAVFAVSVVLAFIMLRGAFVAAHRVLGWTAAAIAVAVFVEPIVEKLSRWVPRGVAVAATFLAIAGIAGGLVFGTVADLDNEVARLQEVMPDAIERLEERDDEIGRIAREIDLSRRSETFLDALDERVGSGSGTLAQNAPTVPVYFVSAILTIFLLVYGPRIAEAPSTRCPRGGVGRSSPVSSRARPTARGERSRPCSHRVRRSACWCSGRRCCSTFPRRSSWG